MDRVIGQHTNLIEDSIESIIESILQTTCTDRCDVRYAYYGDANEFWSIKNDKVVLSINTYTLPLSRCTTLLLYNLISALVQDEKWRQKSTEDIIIYFKGCSLKNDFIEINLGIGRNCVREQENEDED